MHIFLHTSYALRNIFFVHSKSRRGQEVSNRNNRTACVENDTLKVHVYIHICIYIYDMAV